MLSLFEDAGPDGLVDDQIATRLGMLIQSVTPCRGGLVVKGLVVKTTLLRPTRSGRAAIVWMASEHASPDILAEVHPWVPGLVCQRILDALKFVSSEGLTDRAGAELLDLELSRYQSARRTLEKRGLVEASGAFTMDAHNNKSKVWVLSNAGGDA